MKKVLTIMFLLGTVCVAQAQTSQGTVMVGGGLTFTSERTKVGDTNSDPLTSFSISPRVGYFLAENFALGLEIGVATYNYDFFDEDTGVEGNTTAFTVGPFARYYVPMGGETFSFYLQGSFLYGTLRFNPEDGDAGNPVNTITTGISPGFTFFPTKKIGIDLQFSGLQYQNVSFGEEPFEVSSSSLTFGVESLSPSIGLHFFF